MTDASRPRVLVIKLSSLGDLFNPLPAVRLLKLQLNAEIDWVTQSEYVDLVRCFDDVSGIIAFPRRGFVPGAAAFIKQLRARSYDYILDMQGLLKSGMIAGLARGHKKIGPSFAREGSRLFYTAMAEGEGRGRHAVDQCMDSIRPLGVTGNTIDFPVSFPETELDTPAPQVALVPCSRWAAKNWPLDRFVELGRSLQEKCKASLYLVGGPADVSVCNDLAIAIGGGVFNTCGRINLVELGSLLRQMDLVITNDSGPMHMASAAGTRVLGLFGPTDPERTGPYGTRHVVIQAPSFTSHDYNNRDYKQPDDRLMREISVNTVCAAAMEMLKA